MIQTAIVFLLWLWVAFGLGYGLRALFHGGRQ